MSMKGMTLEQRQQLGLCYRSQVNPERSLTRMDKFVDVRLSTEEAELIDFALDLVVDAYGKNLDPGGIVDQLKEKYRGTEARALVDQLRRRCYIATDLD